MMDRRKSGVTLIELIVVIAVMAVLIGFAGLGLSLLTGSRAKDCAKRIENSLTVCRTNSLAKAGQHYVKIYSRDNKVVIESDSAEDLEISKSGVTVTYKISGETEEHTLGGIDEAIEFKFKQGTGSFLGTTYKYIRVTSGRVSYLITCYPITGKVTLDREVG